MKQALITGISSDIGIYLAEKLVLDGYCVSGTYRKIGDEHRNFIEAQEGWLYPCDFAEKSDVKKVIEKIQEEHRRWDLVISSVGTMEPIGKFFDVDFQKWNRNLYVNAVSQLELLQGIYRQLDTDAMVLFWAGGGTNNPFTSYSAYCISKIVLIKMCELLYDEYPKLKVLTAGPGFVKTKIHKETLDAEEMAGANLEKTKVLLRSALPADESLEQIYQFIKWACRKEKEIVSGRNFSIVHDKWKEDTGLENRLRLDENLYKLRRKGNEE